MSTIENPELSGRKNVITNVHTNVHAERVPNPLRTSSVSASQSYEEKRPKVRHLSLLGKSWVYQRRLPRCLTKDQVPVMFRKRVGVLSVPKARIVASKIDRLVDALVFVATEGLKHALSFSDHLKNIDESVIAYMLEAMEAAFHQAVAKLLDEGFQNPEQESAVITACLAKFRADMQQFNKSDFSQHPEGQAFRNAMRFKATTVIGNYDMALNNAEINLQGVQGRSFNDLMAAISKTPTGKTVMDAGIAAFMEAVFGSEEFSEFEEKWTTESARKKAEEAIRETLARQQRGAGSWPRGTVQQPTKASPSSNTKSEAPATKAHQTAVSEPTSESEHLKDYQSGSSNAGAEFEDKTEVFVFLGRPDQKFIARPKSNVRLFSDALADYVAKREIDKQLPIGATLPPEQRALIPSLKGQIFPTARTRDIGTLRSRAAFFIEVLGDHPLDTYTKNDMEFFVHCLRFLPPNSSEKTIRDCGGLRPFLETQMSPETKRPLRKLMAIGTVKDGYLAGLRAVFRSCPLEDRIIDPIGLLPKDFEKLFGKPEAREYFSDVLLRNIVREGIARKSLAFTFLPILGILSSRRLSALTGLKGSDIEVAYEAYEKNENPVYAAKTNTWLDKNGNTVEPSLKTEVSKAHFVLHNFLHEIGFIDWAESLGGQHIFQNFQAAADHESFASKAMGNFFGMMWARKNQVFHSLRHQGIQYFRDSEVTENAVRHQAGHSQIDEHSKYGSSFLPETHARRLANVKLPRWLEDSRSELLKIDFNQFRLNDIRGATRLGKNPKPLSLKKLAT